MHNSTNKYFAYRIGIKWATVKMDTQIVNSYIVPDPASARIKYTDHIERATVWSSKTEAKHWKNRIKAKYPLAELVELGLTPLN